MDKFLLLFIAAVVGEGVVEFLIAPWFDWWKVWLMQQSKPDVIPGMLLRLCACAVGIVIAWQLQLAFFRFAFGVESLSPWFDIVITGVAIGRGSNYVHELLGKLQTELPVKAAEK
jgi:hypothetical protein